MRLFICQSIPNKFIKKYEVSQAAANFCFDLISNDCFDKSLSLIPINIKDYINLFKFSRHSYRNDYALSIALGIVNGHTLNHNSIPWNLASALPEHLISQTGTDTYRVEFKNTNNQSRYIEICNQDFHAMGKKQLGVIVANNS